MMSNRPTTSHGKRVRFPQEPHNYLLETQRIEMYCLEEYLNKDLDQYAEKISRVPFRTMIKLDLKNLLTLSIPREDAELLRWSLTFLKNITELLDTIIKKLRKGTKLAEHLQALYDEFFYYPDEVFVGYTQLQIMEALRILFNSLKVSPSGIYNNEEKKFNKLCVCFESKPTFHPDLKIQLKFWRESLSPKEHKYTMRVPEKSILKKTQSKK